MLVSQKQQILQDVVEQTTKKLEALEQAQDEVNKKFEEGSIDAGQYREFQREVEKTKKSLADAADQLEELKKESESAGKEVDDLGDGFKDSASQAKKFGTSADAAAKDIKSAGKESGTAGSKIEKAGKQAKSSGDDAEKGGKGWSSLQSGLKKVSSFATKALAGIGAAAVAATTGTQEFRMDLSKLEQNATDAGQSIDGANEHLRDLYAITGETDSSIEALSNLMQAGFTDNNLTAAVDALSGAVIKFPDTLKIESLSDSLQETLATGEATGQFAELLERMGINLEDFNEGLSQCTTSAEKQQFALSTLAKTGLAEVNSAYRDTNSSLIDTNNAQFDMQASMAEIGEKLAPAVAKVMGKISDVAGYLAENFDKLAPIIMDVVVALAALKAGLELAAVAQKALNIAMTMNPIGLVITLVLSFVAILAYLLINCEDFRKEWDRQWAAEAALFQSIIDGICNFFTVTIPEAWNSFTQLFSGIPEWWNGIWSQVGQFFQDCWNNIISFFTETIPSWINSIGEWFASLPQKIGYALGQAVGSVAKFGQDLWNWVTTEIPKFFGEIGRWFSELPGNIANWFTDVVNNVAKFGQDLWNWVTTEIPKFFGEIGRWFSELPGNIWNWLTEAVNNVINWGKDLIDQGCKAAQEFFDGIVNTIKGLPDKIYQIGKDIVEGIWNGIKSMGDWLWQQISGFCDGFVQGFKDAFGIHSPSTIMRDAVGKFLALGVGEGFEREMKNVSKDMAAAVPTTFDAQVDSVSRNSNNAILSGDIVNAIADGFGSISTPKQPVIVQFSVSGKNLIEATFDDFAEVIKRKGYRLVPVN